jgi:methylated-DNA-[protein]-cysteine S-methyltransferase
VRYTLASTPVGELLLSADGAGRLAGVHWPAHAAAPRPGAGWRRDEAPFAGVLGQLAEYFAGERRGFDLELAEAGTPFQRRVWAELRAIPYGETVTYAELARRIGRTGAARAVGLANARNPLSIVVPCHRLVGATGALTGYAGGLAVKRRLLDHERTAGA